mgnify:CR=1 FL=1
MRNEGCWIFISHSSKDIEKINNQLNGIGIDYNYPAHSNNELGYYANPNK